MVRMLTEPGQTMEDIQLAFKELSRHPAKYPDYTDDDTPTFMTQDRIAYVFHEAEDREYLQAAAGEGSALEYGHFTEDLFTR